MTREQIDERRQSLGWGYERLAMKCNLSRHMVRQYLLGKKIYNPDLVNDVLSRFLETSDIMDLSYDTKSDEAKDVEFRLSLIESDRRFADAIRRGGMDFQGRRIA